MNWDDSSCSYHSATVKKTRKAHGFEFETLQRKVRSTNQVKTGTNTNPTVIKGVKKPPKHRHLYLAWLSQIITASEMENYCVENNVELLLVGQILKSEAYLKAFHCVFRFDEKKVELPDFLPENVKVSRFYLKETARDWLKQVDQNWLLASFPLKQRCTELNICLHNIRSVRNKTKDVNAFMETNKISLGVFTESWITNNSDDNFIQKQCCPRVFFLYCTKG